MNDARDPSVNKKQKLKYFTLENFVSEAKSFILKEAVGLNETVHLEQVAPN